MRVRAHAALAAATASGLPSWLGGGGHAVRPAGPAGSEEEDAHDVSLDGTGVLGAHEEGILGDEPLEGIVLGRARRDGGRGTGHVDGHEGELGPSLLRGEVALEGGADRGALGRNAPGSGGSRSGFRDGTISIISDNDRDGCRGRQSEWIGYGVVKGVACQPARRQGREGPVLVVAHVSFVVNGDNGPGGNEEGPLLRHLVGIEAEDADLVAIGIGVVVHDVAADAVADLSSQPVIDGDGREVLGRRLHGSLKEAVPELLVVGGHGILVRYCPRRGGGNGLHHPAHLSPDGVHAPAGLVIGIVGRLGQGHEAEGEEHHTSV